MKQIVVGEGQKEKNKKKEGETGRERERDRDRVERTVEISFFKSKQTKKQVERDEKVSETKIFTTPDETHLNLKGWRKAFFERLSK
ncbi:hypothetical protein RUM44_012572 [Polyplax serrata]|uniref:Uncharacterized protein n=1 Tax=Polyplax serrata TaxID=468196 RepID=A0ABR1BFH0_POLSC